MRFIAAACFVCLCTWGQAPVRTIALTSTDGLKPVNAKPDVVEYKGRKAVHAVAPLNNGAIIVLNDKFHDGTLEVDVVGKVAPGADAGARGFVGLAFRVQPDDQHYEGFYLRPTNGRAEDQLRRNHSTQYISEPDYGWKRLRDEHPGVYESYVDLEPGAWTHMKIVVAGQKAQLYVNGSAQPVLIVNDMKGNGSPGSLALWMGDGTEAYFSNLKVTAAK